VLVAAAVPVPDGVVVELGDDELVTVGVVWPAPVWVLEMVVPHAEQASRLTIERPTAIHGAL
jgi:hypothetical protein